MLVNAARISMIAFVGLLQLFVVSGCDEHNSSQALGVVLKDSADPSRLLVRSTQVALDLPELYQMGPGEIFETKTDPVAVVLLLSVVISGAESDADSIMAARSMVKILVYLKSKAESGEDILRYPFNRFYSARAALAAALEIMAFGGDRSAFVKFSRPVFLGLEMTVVGDWEEWEVVKQRLDVGEFGGRVETTASTKALIKKAFSARQN